MEHSDSARQLASPSLGWMFDDPSPAAQRSRANLRRDWHHVERGEPRSPTFLERWSLTVRGQVQGVGYRAACNRRARELGLSGWVRNCPDGSVAIEAEGPINQLNELRLWCERGPSGAQVLGVTSSLLSPCRDDWFEVRH